MQEVLREQIPLNKHPVNQWAKRHLQQIPPDALEEYSNEPHRLKPGETSSNLYLINLLWYGLQYRQMDNPTNYRRIERKLMELDSLPPKQAWQWMMGTNAGPLTVPPPSDPNEQTPLKAASNLVDWFRGILFHERMETMEALEVYPVMRMPAHLPPKPNTLS